MLPDYKEKQAILTLKLDVIQRRISKYYHYHLRQTSESEQYTVFEQLRLFIKKFNNRYKDKVKNAWYKATLINHAKYKRKQRVHKKITPIIESSNGLFLTLTFNDNLLSNTQPHIRRKYVQRYCKANSMIYCANIDYGEDYGREHYHAVIQGDHVSKWPHGFYKVQRIRINATSGEKLSKYITKLTNHAVKKTASNTRLIYSRNK